MAYTRFSIVAFQGEEGDSAGILKKMLVRCECVEGYYDMVVVRMKDVAACAVGKCMEVSGLVATCGVLSVSCVIGPESWGVWRTPRL